MRKGMVFGVFDNFHPGHEFFLSQAVSMCDELIVVVTLPEIVFTLKGKLPCQEFAHRVAAIKRYNSDLIVIAGDDHLGSWKVLTEYSPDIVLLGYDQHAVATELQNIKTPYKFIDSFRPEIYKSSIIK